VVVVSWIPTLSPAGPQAESLRFILWVTLGLAAVILTLIIALVFVALHRYRARGRGEGDARQTEGNVKLEVVWTVVPALIIAGLFILMVGEVHGIDPAPPPGRKPDIVVVGHQWWWEVRYPGSGVVTANELHVPVGRRLLLRMESADVIHDFWAPQLTRKIDMVPGHPNTVWLEVDRAGVYDGECAAFCGAQHANMRFKVFAQPPAQFQAWLKKQAGPAAPPRDSTAIAGVMLFLGNGLCARCHTIRGLSAGPDIGPDLTHMGGRTTLAAATLPNTDSAMARWLKDPQAVKPGNHMPDLHLSDADVHALVTYLESLK
jgi:cytochrome c oxidase subunit 2